MARSFHQLILLSTCAALGAVALAEPAAAPEKKRRKEAAATPSPEFENVRKALDALTPEQRKRFQENFVRWSNLSPAEKKALRDREDVRKKFMDQELQAAINESGLELKGERRQQFVKQYAQERRKIEEQLRRETMEKRKPLVHEMLQRLKEEFAVSPEPDALVAPAAEPGRP